MRKPGIVTRFAGSPLGAALLFGVYGLVIYSWWRGEARSWLALCAVGAFFRTLPAIRRMRAYKSWAEQWKEMGEDDEPLSRPSSSPALGVLAKGEPRRASRLFIVLAAGVLLGGMFYAGQQPDGQTPTSLLAVASVAFLYLAFVTFRGMVRKARGVTVAGKPETVKAGKGPSRAAAVVPVSWVMGRASSSPSREDVLKSLPGYSARLLLPERKTRKLITIKRETAKA